MTRSTPFMLLLVGVLLSASDDKLNPQAQGALSSGSVRITGGPLEFPDRLTNAGATAAKTITITNTSATEDLHFTGPGISLATNPPAGLVDEWLGSPGVATANYVFSLPALTPMGPGESRRISVAFDPVTAGTKYVEVHITTSDPSSPLVKVRIAGIGVVPFDPAATNPGPTQVIGMRPGPARAISPAFLGFNGNVFFTQPESRNPWDDLKLSAAVAKLNAATVKYPAGTYGNYWDWDIEWIDQAFPGTQMASQARLRQFWNVDATPPDAWYPLANFAARLFQPYKVEPVYQLNVLTRGPGDAGLTHALRGLASARAAGLPVRFVELGNKINNNDEDPATDDVYPTASDYADMAKRWASAIKVRYPKAKVAIAGNYTKQLQDNARSFEWNRLLEQALAGNTSIDAWKVHLYSGSGFNLADRDQLAEWNAFAGTEGAARMLGQPYRFLDYTFNINYWPTPQPIAVATFNSLEQRSVTNGTWAHGLLLANFVNVFLRDKRVLYAGVQNIWSPRLVDSAIFRDPATFNALPASVKAASGQGPNWTATKYNLTAMGEALQSTNQVLRGMTSSRPLIFDKRVIVHPHIKYKINPYPGLWGFKFSNATRQSVLLINNTGQRFTVSTANVAPVGVGYRSKAGDSVNSYKTYVKNASSLRKTTGRVPNTRRLTLPPYSITTVGPF